MLKAMLSRRIVPGVPATCCWGVSTGGAAPIGGESGGVVAAGGGGGGGGGGGAELASTPELRTPLCVVTTGPLSAARLLGAMTVCCTLAAPAATRTLAKYTACFSSIPPRATRRACPRAK